MVSSRLDVLARVFGTARDRRGLLRGLAPAAVTGLLATLPLGDATAKKKRKRRNHKKKHKKKQPPPIQCSGSEVLCDEQCVEGVCCPGAACEVGNCKCDVTIEGDAFCAAHVTILCEVAGNCTSNDECEAGARCVKFGNNGCCAPECGTV